MQTAPPIFCDDAARQVTLAAQTQAVERAIQFMHTHLHELLTLEDLAAVAYLSPFHFTRVFGRLIGIPPGEFLSALRFQAARRLLVTTALSVTDICFAVGYTSIGSFTSRFTHRVGLSPRLLRQRAQAFEPRAAEPAELGPMTSSGMPRKRALLGRISAPATFRGTIYVGLLPGEKLLLGNNASPLIIWQGQVSGEPNLVLHPPRLTDPPLVVGLPLLGKEDIVVQKAAV